jgi:hypothetical protein
MQKISFFHTHNKIRNLTNKDTMNIFDINNPRHITILKEELARAKRLMEQSYSADGIWDTMTQRDRKEALYIAKEPNPDALLDASWDDIPADTQDLIDLSDYELARKNQAGGSLLRGIKTAIKQHPDAERLVAKFLNMVGRENLDDITVNQAYKLNPAIWKHIASKNPQPEKVRSASNIDPYDRENPSTGFMGSTYRGD